MTKKQTQTNTSSNKAFVAMIRKRMNRWADYHNSFKLNKEGFLDYYNERYQVEKTINKTGVDNNGKKQ